MKRAWQTTWGGISSIVAAETRGKAAAATMRTVREMYGSKASWKSLRVVRAPEFDQWAEVDATGHCWDRRLLPRNT